MARNKCAKLVLGKPKALHKTFERKIKQKQIKIQVGQSIVAPNMSSASADTTSDRNCAYANFIHALMCLVCTRYSAMDKKYGEPTNESKKTVYTHHHVRYSIGHSVGQDTQRACKVCRSGRVLA